MEIIHRVGFSRLSLVAELPELDELEVKEVGHLSVFDIAESDEKWPAVQAWIAKVRASNVVTTKFTESEITNARWVALRSDWLWSYPQPEDVIGYLKRTYDLKDYCDICGVGAVQNDGFRITGEPKWGKKGILQLNWVFSELFVKPEVWLAIFKPQGIGFRPVFDVKGRQMKTVVQLEVDSVAELNSADSKYETCAKCGVVKYSPTIRGFMPPFKGEPAAAVVKTKQIFGGGRRAFRRIVISQSLARELLESEVRGASLIPLAAHIG